MNIKSTKCHTPKAYWGPSFDKIEKSLPQKAGEGPTLPELEKAVDTYIAVVEGGSETADGLHPFCADVDPDMAMSSSRTLVDRAKELQEIFDKSQPGESKPLAAQDLADTFNRHAETFDKLGAEAQESIAPMVKERKKQLAIQTGLSLVGMGAGIALGLGVIPAVPGIAGIALGIAGFAGTFDAVANISDENLGSADLREARNEVRVMASEAEHSRDFAATAQAWTDKLKATQQEQ